MTVTSAPVQSVARPGYRWVVIGLYWAANAAAFLATFSFLVLLPIVRQDMGLSVQQVGLLASLPWASMAVLSLPFSVVLSRFRPRLLLAISLALGALFAFGQAFAPTFELLFLARLGLCIIVIARLPASTLLTQQWFEDDEVTRVTGVGFGLNNIAQAASLGVTPLIAGLVGGWRPAMIVYGVIIGILCMLWLAGGRERPLPASRRHDSAGGSPIRVMFRRPSLWLVASCQLGAAVGYGAFLSFWPTYAVEVQGVNLATAGALITLWPVGSLIGSFGAPILARLIGGRKRVIIIAGLLVPVCYLTLIVTTNPIAAGALLLTIGFLALVVTPLIVSLPYSYPGIQPREIAVATGAIFSVSTVGAAAGPILVSNIQAGGGTLTLGMTIAGSLAVTLGIAGIFLPNLDRKAA